MAAYPLYQVAVDVSIPSELTSAVVADFGTFIDISTSILSGINLAKLDGNGLRVCVEQVAQGVRFDVFPDRVNVLFLHSSGPAHATAFEIQACTFLLHALRACCGDNVSAVNMQCQHPSGASMLLQARTFADATLARVKSFALQCSDPRAVCVRDIFLKLKDVCTTVSDVAAFLETFRVSVSTDAAELDAVLLEASRALVNSDLSLEKLRIIDEFFAALV
jgi:hypothetical protein